MIPTRWCPPHFTPGVRTFLDRIFPDRWVGRVEPITWPQKFPDPTPLGFFLCVHMKCLIYETPVNTDEGHAARIVAVVGDIMENPDTVFRVH